jgi:ribosomal protein S18 acetylase RimI-like enzyme
MAATRFRLRPGTADDLPALLHLDSSFSTEWVLFLQRRGGPVEQTVELHWRKVRPAGSRRSLEADEASLREDLRRADRFVVALAARRIVGYVMLSAQWNRTVAIDAIVVDRPRRDRGLGRRLVAEAQAFARRRGLRALSWEAQTDNRHAIEFAAAQGFRLAAVHDALYHNRGAERQLEPGFRGLAALLIKELDEGAILAPPNPQP